MSWLLQPLVFWQATPPPLCCTSVLISRGCTRVVTGCARGSMTLWALTHGVSEGEPSTTAQPLVFVSGECGGIVALAEGLCDSGPVFCALTADGSVVICDLQDGTCLGTLKSVVPEASAIAALPGLRHVLVAGSASSMVVLDLATHSKTRSLQTYGLVVGLPAGLPNLTPSDGKPLEFVTLSSERYLQYWDVNQVLQGTDKGFAVKSVLVDVADSYPCTCDHHPAGSLVLVVYGSQWLLYLHHEERPFYTMAVDDVYFAGGCFVGGGQVAIYTAEADVWLYTLPNRLLELAREHRRNPDERSAFVQAALSSLLPPKTVRKSKVKAKFKTMLRTMKKETLKTMKKDPRGVKEKEKEKEARLKSEDKDKEKEKDKDKNKKEREKEKVQTVKWAALLKEIGRESRETLSRPLTMPSGLASPRKSPSSDMLTTGHSVSEKPSSRTPSPVPGPGRSQTSMPTPDGGKSSHHTPKLKILGSARSAMHAMNVFKVGKPPRGEKPISAPLVPSPHLPSVPPSSPTDPPHHSHSWRSESEGEEEGVRGRPGGPASSSGPTPEPDPERESPAEGLDHRRPSPDTETETSPADTGQGSEGEEDARPREEQVEPQLMQTMDPLTNEREHVAMSCPPGVDGAMFVRATSSTLEISGAPRAGDRFQQLHVTSFDSGWPSPSPGNDDDPPEGPVVTVLIDLDTVCLAWAYRSGRVVVHDAVRKSRCAWVADPLGVRAMLQHGPYLITGGPSGAVKVWEMLTGTLRRAFHWHSAAVERLFAPPPAAVERHGFHAASVGEDGAVVFYELQGDMAATMVLPGNDVPITAVRWAVEWDLLLVTCGSGRLFVWGLGRGTLERVVEVADAAAFAAHLELTDCFAAAPRGTGGLITSAGPLLQTQVLYGDGPDPQPVLLVDIRALIAAIRAEADPSSLSAKRPSVGSPVIKTQSNVSMDSNLDALNTSQPFEPLSPITARLRFPLPRPVVAVLSYLLQCDDGPPLVRLREVFGLPAPPPRPSAAFGFAPYAQTLSLLLPRSMGPAVYAISPVWSAVRCVTVAAALHALLAFQPTELRPLVQECLNHCLVQQPKRIPGYQPPSFQWCIQWLGDPSTDVRIGAQLTMNALVRQLRPPDLQALCVRLLEACAADKAHQNPASVIALCLICDQAPGRVPPQALPAATQGLLRVVEAGGSMHSVAIQLLAEHLPTWRPHIPDLPAVLGRLFELAIPDRPEAAAAAATANGKEGSDHDIAHTAEGALVAFGAIEPQAFFDYVESRLHTLSPQRQQAMVLCIARLMRRDRLQLYPCLPRVVGVILGVLDPHQIAVRDLCLPAVTSVLGYAVRYYNMVAFEQTKQKLAVGYPTGDVVLYDLRTASRYLHFPAHTKPIACLHFSPDGKRLATFCSEEATVKVWQYDSSHRKPKQSFAVKNNKRYISVDEMLQHLRFKWPDERQLHLFGADTDQPVITFAV